MNGHQKQIDCPHVFSFQFQSSMAWSAVDTSRKSRTGINAFYCEVIFSTLKKIQSNIYSSERLECKHLILQMNTIWNLCKKKCHFDCARNSTFEGLQTNATNYSLARGYFQVSFRARFIWKHKMSKCLFYEFVIE